MPIRREIMKSAGGIDQHLIGQQHSTERERRREKVSQTDGGHDLRKTIDRTILKIARHYMFGEAAETMPPPL